MTRTAFSEEFKRKAVEVSLMPGQNAETAAKAMGCSRASIHIWRRYSKHRPTVPTIKIEESELSKLKTEINTLKDIIKMLIDAMDKSERH